MIHSKKTDTCKPEVDHHQNSNYYQLNLEFSSLQNKQYLLFKPPHREYFVMEAQADYAS
jgi:hypothetical protein